MVKKNEAEQAIRSLSTKWYRTLSETDREHPRFGVFVRWMRENGYGGYLEFRSTMGASYDAEMWFDQELGQSWRN